VGASCLQAMEIELNLGEQAVAQRLAELRYLTARANGAVDGKIGPQSVEQTDLEGVAAELAFCKVINVCPDFTIGETPDFDCRYRALTIDVKTTQHLHGRLLVSAKKLSHPADWYALVIGTFPGPYQMLGMMHKSDLFVDRYLQDLGYGLTYVVPQSDLMPVLDWIAEVDA
jgi:hypothetical protein